MKVYFDMEFTGLHKETTLISLGMVADDGRTFYAEFTDYNRAQVDDWVSSNVLPKLDMSPTVKKGDELFFSQPDDIDVRLVGTKKVIAWYAREWLGYYDKVTMCGDCLSWDWVLFCDLFGHAFNIPSHIHYIPLDLSTLMWTSGYDQDMNREAFARMDANGHKHNALFDAQIIRACWHKLETERGAT